MAYLLIFIKQKKIEIKIILVKFNKNAIIVVLVNLRRFCCCFFIFILHADNELFRREIIGKPHRGLLKRFETKLHFC